MLSAIVVNKPNVDSGRMELKTLKGSIGAARQLGYVITSEEAFLREQQARVFAWAQNESPKRQKRPQVSVCEASRGRAQHLPILQVLV